MRSRKKMILGSLLIVLVLALFAGAWPQKCADTVCNEAHPDAPTYGALGPFPVGKRDLTADSDPSLAMKMWYPAVAQDDSAEATPYRYEIKMGAPLGIVKIASSASRAVTDAPFDLAQGPYPLVVLSSGFGVGADAYGWLAEHLASYGFVVIAPEHVETLDPQNQLWRAAVTRPQEILAVFSYVDAAMRPGGGLEGLIETEATAVVGHSYGGYTALAAAGAQIDTASFKAHCEEARQTDDPTAWLCDMLLPHLADMAELAWLEGMPEGLWPESADPRVDAVVTMAGDAYFFGQSGLATIDVPVLALGGTLDSGTPFQWGPRPTYEYVASSTKALLALEGAEHMIFTNPCQSIRTATKLLAGEFCSDSVWNRGHAHDLIGHFTTAFLLAELKQDKAAAAVLIPSAADFPTIAYEAQGY